MTEIQGKSILVRVSEGSSYWELTVHVQEVTLAQFLSLFVKVLVITVQTQEIA